MFAHGTPAGIVPLATETPPDNILSRLLSKEPEPKNSEESQKEPWDPLALLSNPVAGPSGLGKRSVKMSKKFAKQNFVAAATINV